MAATPDQIQIAKYLTETIGGNPVVLRPEPGVANIDVIRLDDPEAPMRKFYSTVGLSEHELKFQGRTVPFRLELCMVGLEIFAYAPQILAAAADRIVTAGWESQPGAVFKDLVTVHAPELAMKHIYFTRPYLWQERLSMHQLESKTVTWLLAVPISDDELAFKVQQGDRALEAGFGKFNVDVSNLARDSVLRGDVFH